MQLIPPISDQNIEEGFKKAKLSSRKRYPKILHKQGDKQNKVFNFLLKGTYMRPHKHLGKGKIEKMTLILGSFLLFYFNNKGEVVEQHILDIGKKEYIEVPSNTWHTYTMLSDKVLIYETMEGVYDPQTWKDLASWAPAEDGSEGENYLSSLYDHLK